MKRRHAALPVSMVIFSFLAAHSAVSQTPALTLTASPAAVAEFRQGWAAAEMNQFEPSIKHLKAALSQDPGFGLARVLYVFQGGVSNSQQTAELNRGVADAAKGGTAELLLAMAWREQAENRAPQARALLKAVTELLPTDPFLASSLASANAGAGRADAYAALKEVAKKFPDYAPIYNSLAYSGWAAGDHVAALTAAEKQVQLAPRNPNAHDSYAELMQWNGKLPEALHHYQEAVDIDPTFVEALIGMAEVETLQGHYDKAAGYVNQAIARTSIPSQKVTYMRDLAGVYAVANNRPKGLAALAAAVNAAKAEGNNQLAALMLAQEAASYAAGGDAKSAHAYLDMARATYPEPAAGVSFFAAMAHGRLKHWAPATAAIAAAKAAPDAALLGDRILAAEAFLATGQGKPADAIALLSKADVTDALVAGRLAEAYAATGNTAEATKLQQQISNDYALNLANWAGANARARSRVYLMSMTPRKK